MSTRSKTKNPTPQHSKPLHPTYLSESPLYFRSRGNKKKAGQSDSDIPKMSSARSYRERKSSSAAVVEIDREAEGDVIEVGSVLVA